MDVLLPATDAGVLVQVMTVLIVGAIALRAAWRHVEWRIFVIGAWVLLLSLLGVRAVH